MHHASCIAAGRRLRFGMLTDLTNTRSTKVLWAMPHSEFLAWLSSATLKILSQVFQVGSWCCKNKLDLLIELIDKTTSIWRRLKYEDDLKLKRSDLVYPARAYTTLVVLVCSLIREGGRRLCYELDLMSFWTGIDLALILLWFSLILSWLCPNLVYAVLF